MSDLLNSASLVMIPSGYKEDVVYSQIPTDGSGDLAFTRASNGTRVNSAGLVEVCPWNLAQQSETFNVSPWVNESNIVTNNSIVAPNGTTTADTISNSNTTALFRTYQGPIIGYAQPQTLTFSTYFKYKDHRYISFGLTDDTDYRSQVVVDLQNMVITENYKSNSGDVLTSSIESVGNGWYRIVGTLTYNTALAGGNLYFLYKFQTSGTFSAVGTYQTGTGFYMWGAQLNIGSTAKPYFPTTDRLNVPRLTYQNGGGGCPSLLLEKQSTNLVTYSEQFDDASWSLGNSSITANATTSPDGTQNAEKLYTNTATSTHQIRKTISSVTAQNYTMSIFAKKGELNYIRFWEDGQTGKQAYFNLNTGVATNVDMTSASIENMGNGWYRCSAVIAIPASGVFGYRVLLTPDGTTTSFTGNGSDGVFLYGAQLEASSYATSYIPTTSSSATRVADACYKTGISSLIGQTQGTLFVDVDFKYNNETTDKDTRIWSIWDDSDIKLISIWARDNALRYQVYDAATSLNVENSITASQGRHKVALAYNGTSLILYMDGSLVINTTMPQSAPATSRAGLAYFWYINAIQHSIGINQALLFKTALTTTELASLTTL